MDDSNERKFQKELNGGLVGLVLLAVLAQSGEDLYGYEIAKRLASANDGTSIFKEGTIYPVLRALSAGNLLTSRIVPSYSGRRAAITASLNRDARCSPSGKP